jgi:aminocarboxymuconate-semialdehyde decarboxylase
MPGLDVHAHLIPPTVLSAARRGSEGLAFRDGDLLVGDDVVPTASLARPDDLVAWLDQHHLDRAVVSVPPPLFRHQLAGSAARRWSELVNEGLELLVAAYGGRLERFAHLPMGDPPAAADGAANLGDGWSGVAIGTMAGASMLDDRALAPVWESLEDRLVFIHPVTGPDRRLDRYYLHNLLGNPYETGLAAAALVFAGVPDRFPRLRFCLAHAGGVTAALAGRWQRGFETARPGVPRLAVPPRQALGRFFVDSLAHSPDVLALALSVFGPSQVLFGSDWPFPMGSPAPEADLSGLDESRRQAILEENAARALGRPTAPAS